MDRTIEIDVNIVVESWTKNATDDRVGSPQEIESWKLTSFSSEEEAMQYAASLARDTEDFSMKIALKTIARGELSREEMIAQAKAALNRFQAGEPKYY